MNYIVAVSGGVDSVVLLDMLAKQKEHNLVVAHFDHGIRVDSDADARFVWELAKKYELPFEVWREELGDAASENTARNHRYAFLRDIAKKYSATIVTAHHADDVVETIAINLTRGTGWRGLTVMGDETICRPLLGLRKQQLYTYALEHQLEYIEDETNRDHTYTRNHIRQKLSSLLDPDRQQLLKLRSHQRTLRRAITRETERHLLHLDRYFFIMIPEPVALELLRAHTDAILTIPQQRYLLERIKTASPGSVIEPGGNIRVTITAKAFHIEHK